MAERRMIGDILFERRRSLSLSIDRVVNDTKLQRRMIEAFEDSDFDAMPPKGYAQATLASYARYLGLNPNDILRIYDDQLYEYERDAGRGTRTGRGGRSRRSQSLQTQQRRTQRDAANTSVSEPEGQLQATQWEGSYPPPLSQRRPPRTDRAAARSAAEESAAPSYAPDHRDVRRYQQNDPYPANEAYQSNSSYQPNTAYQGSSPYQPNASYRDSGSYQSSGLYQRPNSYRDHGYTAGYHGTRLPVQTGMYPDPTTGAYTPSYNGAYSPSSYSTPYSDPSFSTRDRRSAYAEEPYDRTDLDRSREHTQLGRIDEGYEGGQSADSSEQDRYRTRSERRSRTGERQSFREVFTGFWSAIYSDRRTFLIIICAAALTLIIVLAVFISSCVRSSSTTASLNEGGNIPVTTLEEEILGVSNTALIDTIDLNSLPAGSTFAVSVSDDAETAPWLEVYLDGVAVCAEIAYPGSHYEWTLDTTASIQLSSIKGVMVTVNGTAVTPVFDTVSYTLDLTAEPVEPEAEIVEEYVEEPYYDEYVEEYDEGYSEDYDDSWNDEGSWEG